MVVIERKWRKLPILLCLLALLMTVSCPPKANIHLPTEEIEGLKQQLKDVAKNLEGQARIEMEALIDRKDMVISKTLEEIEALELGLKQMVESDIAEELERIKKELRDLLDLVNQMVKDRQSQINEVTRARMEQFNSVIDGRLTQVNRIKSRAIESFNETRVRITERGNELVIVIMDQALFNLVKVILIVALGLVLLVVGILAWRGWFPKKLHWIIVVSILLLIFIGASVTLLVSDKAMELVMARVFRVDKVALAGAVNVAPPGTRPPGTQAPGTQGPGTQAPPPEKTPLPLVTARPKLVLFDAPPDSQPSGLAWDGESFWMSSYMKNGGIYKINGETGGVIRKYTPPVTRNNGYGPLAIEGSYLWQADSYGSGLFKMERDTLKVVQKLESPDKYPKALAWDGRYLWVYGYPSKKLYRIDPANREKTEIPLSLNLGEVQSMGICYVKGYYYISIDRMVYKFKLQAGRINKPSASRRVPYTRTESLTWDGTYLWAASFDRGKIFRIGYF